MATSIGDLLDGLHSTAWTLCQTRPVPADAPQVVAGVLAGWPPLAEAARRAIDNTPLEVWARRHTVPLRATLGLIAAHRTDWGQPELSGQTVAPDPALHDMALRVGAIADLMVDAPRPRDDRHQFASMGLVANLAAPLNATASATIALAAQARAATDTRWLLRQLDSHTQPYLHSRPADRVAYFDDITVPRSDEHSLDAALHHWKAATLDALGTPLRATRAVLQTAAVDLVILTGAAATATWAGVHQGQLDRDHGHKVIDALRAANQAWRLAAAWPAHLRLDGEVRPPNAAASAALRAAIGDTLRTGNDWATPDQIAQRANLPGLLRTTREAVRAADDVGDRHYTVLRLQIFGSNRLWIAARAIDDPSRLHGFDLLDARHRRRWIPRPLEEPSGLKFFESAALAAKATSAARTVAEPAATQPLTADAADVALVSGRLTAGLAQAITTTGPWEIPTAAPISTAARHERNVALVPRPARVVAR